MARSTSHKPVINRRKTLAGLAGLATVGMTRGSAQPIKSDDLHSYAAKKARDLAAGRPITLRLLIPFGSGDNVRPVVSAFKAATDIDIEPVEVPVDDINTQLALDWMSGRRDYDLALPATFGLPDLVASGAIISLTDLAARHEPKGFRDGILYQIGDSFDDDIYGFQSDGDAYVMFYHRDFLEDPEEQARYADAFGAGLDVPLTWAELDRQIAWFNRPDKGRCGGLLFRTAGYVAWEWWVRFHAKGVWPLSHDLEPQIAGDAGVEALEELIRVSEHLCEGVNYLGLFENWKRYARGDVYCNIGWGGTQKFLNGPKSAMRGRMTYGPTPGGVVNNELLVTPYFNWGWNYVVTSNSVEPEIAYLYALFASSPEMSTRAIRQQGGYFDPFRPEHYSDPQIREIYSQAFLDVHQKSLRGSIPDLYLANQSEYFRALSDWLNRALNRSVTPQQALRRVAQSWQLINNRSNPDKQRERWRQLRLKYPEHVRTKLSDIS